MSNTATRSLAKAVLIALMAIGSVVLWLGIPIGWLWVGSMMQSGSQSTGFGPYLLVIAGIVVTAVIMARILSRLNRLYGEVGGADPVVRVRMPWHRSMRGEEDSRAPRSVLDVVMVISVSIAVAIFAGWFFLFAGSPLPN